VTRIVVAGAGALGSVIGGLLTRAGEDVVLLAHGEHATALRSRPLELRLPGEAATVAVDVAEQAEGDVIVLTAKRFDSAAALARVRGIPQVALSLQNGPGKNDELLESFPPGTVTGALTTIAARIVEPGTVSCAALGITYIGAEHAAAVEIAERFQAAGMTTLAVDDAAAAEWSKLAHVAGVMLVQALTSLPLHELFAQRDAALLLRRLIVEVGDLAAAAGSQLIDLEGLLPVATLAAGGDEHATAFLAGRSESLVRTGATSLRTSMLASIEEGRRTELETIHGELVWRARSAAVAVPVLEACYRLARLRGIT
jgi:2-dehydropantoate 2-reductase